MTPRQLRVLGLSAAKDSLVRNAALLYVNIVIGVAGGFLFTLASTQYFSTAAVGYAATLFSAMGLVTAISNLGMDRTILRFYGGKSDSTTVAEFSAALVAVAGVALVLGLGAWPILSALKIPYYDALYAIAFAVICTATAVKSMFDQYFTARRQSGWTLLQNTAFTSMKLGWIAVFVLTGYETVWAIFGSQLIAALSALAISVYALRRIAVRLTKPDWKALRARWRFALASFSTDLVGGLPTNIVPIIVLARLGPVQAAKWFVISQILSFVTALLSAIGQAVLAEMAHSLDRLSHFVRRGTVIMISMVGPVALVVFILAEPVLKVFGGAYADQASLLRLTIVFAFLGLVNFLSGSVLVMEGRMTYLLITNVINGLIVVVLTAVLQKSLTGVAHAWILGELVNIFLFVGGAWFYAKRSRIGNVETMTEGSIV